MNRIFFYAVIIASLTMAYSCSNNKQSGNSNNDSTEVVKNNNDLLTNCKVVTSNDYVIKVNECRKSEECEMQLPLNLKFGMSQQEYLDSMTVVLTKSGLIPPEKPTLEKGLIFDIPFQKLTLHINPGFTAEDKLYQLEMSIAHNSSENAIEVPVRQLIDFYVGNNGYYQDFGHYTIDHQLFFAAKGNHLIIPDRKKALLLFVNVPQIPEEQYKEWLDYCIR